jgi:hypothetical protein
MREERCGAFRNPPAPTLTDVLAYGAVTCVFAITAWRCSEQSSLWETVVLQPGDRRVPPVVPFSVGRSQLVVGFGDLGVRVTMVAMVAPPE